MRKPAAAPSPLTWGALSYDTRELLQGKLAGLWGAATDAAAAISRIADGFPVERQNAVRQELAMALAAVLTQSLIQTRTGSLVPVAELLLVSYGARQHIRKNTLQHLNQEITITRKAGSFTLEESLARLVAGGVIDRGDAMLRAAHPEELESLLRGT